MNTLKIAACAAVAIAAVVVIDWLLGFEEMGKAVGADR